MARTLKDLVSDLELRLTSAKPSNDFTIPREQFSFWIETIRDKLSSQYLNSILNRRISMPIEGVYIDSRSGLTPTVVNEAQNIYSIDLPYPLLDLWMDYGVYNVTDDSGNLLNRTTYNEFDIYKNLFISRPSEDNLFFYRLGGKVYIAGHSSIATKTFSVQLVPSAPFGNGVVDYDGDNYMIAAGIVPDLLDLAEEKARREYNVQLADYQNDGQQD